MCQSVKQQAFNIQMWTSKKGGLINDSCLVFVGMITFADFKKQEFLECPKRDANWGYSCHRIWFVNKEQKDGGTVRWVALAPPQNGTCCVFGSGFELLHRVFKRESYYPWFGEGRLRQSACTVCLTFTKPAGPTLQALKSLFTVERREILLSPRSATLWNEPLKCTLCNRTVCWGEMIPI